MAGFEVTTYGRFCGDHRGSEAPLGVIDGGLKLQVAPEGNPLHATLTVELNPFSGVTVKVAVPVCP